MLRDVMPRKRLIDYLPPFMQDFSEIKAIMKTENLELDRAYLDILVPLEDAFIMDCDEYALRKYEKFVGVVPDPADTPDIRKARVLIWWNNFLPYTYRVFVRRLDRLCGTGNYEISGSLENYELFLKTGLSAGGQVQELEHLLIQMVPMNMNCGADNVFTCKSEGFFGCTGCVCCMETITITSDFDDKWDISGSSYFRGGTSFASSIGLTSDFTEKWQSKGVLQSHGTVDCTDELQISNDARHETQVSGRELSAAFSAYVTENMSEPVSGTVSVNIVSI